MTESPPAVGDILWTIARPADEYIDDQPGRPILVEITGEFPFIDGQQMYVGSPHNSYTGKVDRSKDRECEVLRDRLYDTETDALEGYAHAMKCLAGTLRARADDVLREAWWADQAVDRWMSGN